MSKARILIVDDEIIIARELEIRLTSLGYEVVGIASSGAESIQLATETQPDLLLMDIVLKGEMDGVEAAHAIRSQLKTPIIFVTAYTDKQTLDRAKLAEPFGYIVKPFSERELEANIEMALYRHRMESTLRQVERWFVAAEYEMSDGVVATDRQRRIVIFNAAAEAITGWTREQAIGSDLNHILRLVRKAGGEPISFDSMKDGPVVCLSDDTYLIDRSMNQFPINSTASYIRDNHDRPTGIIAILRDPTGQRHGALLELNADVAYATAHDDSIRGMLQLCAESLVRTLKAAFARIWTVDSTGNTLRLEASAGRYTHINGKHSRVSFGECKIGSIARSRTPSLTNNVQDSTLIDDPVWARDEGLVSFAGYPLLVGDRLVGVVAMFARHPLTDSVLDALDSVAHTIAVGIERRRLADQVRQSQKMEAIGQLAGGVAHDFNNMLTVISGYCEILLRDERLSEAAVGAVRHIEAAGVRAASLTRQLLTFSRKNVAGPKLLDLNAIVEEMAPMLKRIIGEHYQLTTLLEPTLDSVTADPGLIEQVVMNLVLNSRDAMTKGGRISIETANIDLNSAVALTFPAAVSGPFVMLAVSDTGHGMTPEVASRVFEPFFTTKELGQGTGLGLSTVHGIIHQIGGQVMVHSSPGTGTTFKAYIPSSGDHIQAASTQPDAGHRPSGTETILLVEDEDSVRILTKSLLEQCGYEVLDATQGVQALRTCAEHNGPIHLVLADVVMPAMAGREMVDRIIELRPDIKVLYMSGYTDDAVIKLGVLQEETAFLHKPFTPIALAKKVREVLDK